MSLRSIKLCPQSTHPANWHSAVSIISNPKHAEGFDAHDPAEIQGSDFWNIQIPPSQRSCLWFVSPSRITCFSRKSVRKFHSFES
jgi:hypothetical protein